MLTEIDRHLPSLTRAERAVARWVLKHPRQATAGTIADVARAAGTSEPTVIRFCRSIGLDGFRELKLRLAEAVGRPGSFAHKDVDPNDSVEEAVIKVLDRSLQALNELRAGVSTLPFEPAVAAMAKARQIVFVGLGASGAVAEDACQKFFRLGIPCATATDTPTLLQMAAIAERGDVFVIISQTGRWPPTVRGAERARGRGAIVIVVSEPGSPLASSASLVFGNTVAEDLSIYTPMSSRLAILALLDALQVALAIRLGPAAEQRLKASKEALAEPA